MQFITGCAHRRRDRCRRQDQPTYHARSGSEESSRGSNEQLGQLVGPINHDVVAAVDAVRVPGRIGLALRQPLVDRSAVGFVVGPRVAWIWTGDLRL